MSVFVSHSFKDEAVYSALCLALDSSAVERWDPKMMSVGDSLSDQLRKAIGACEACIFIATRSSIESPWCLAEVGAFWGSGKRVLIFLADPDLTDSVLPPQFKGNLSARNAPDLIAAARAAATQTLVDRDYGIEFFASSGDLGHNGWTKLLESAKETFDIMGVTLLAWRQTPRFEETVLRRAKEGCRVRVLMMHLDNPVLPVLASDYEMLKTNLSQNFSYFESLAAESGTIEVRQLRTGLMHFHLSRSERAAIVIQFLASQMWGKGPIWKCSQDSQFYRIVVDEFDALWKRSAPDAAPST